MTNDEIDALMNVASSGSTPERIVPGRTDRAETAAHMARYGFAAAHARGVALDLGSGVAYGTAIIATAPSVAFCVAFDISSRALAFGKNTYREKMSFIAGDAGALPFSESSVDSIICLEAIEHVPHPEKALGEMARILRPEGSLVISTPNKWVTSALSRRPLNPFHVCEWYPTRFRELVSRFFEVEEVLGQSWCSVGFTSRSLTRRWGKEVLRSLHVLEVAQQRRRGRRGGMAQGDFRKTSSAIDVPTQGEVLAVWPRPCMSTWRQGLPATIILVARSLRKQ